MGVKAKLTADLFANTSRFESGMKRARVSFKSFSKSVKVGAKRATVAITAITAVLGALTLKQSAVIDETAKLSKALGVNIREFQALVLAASEAGISQEQMGTIITKSQRTIVEASRGLTTYKRSFDTLNLSAKDLIKLSPEKQFEEIAKALIKVDNDTLRTATALEIFGRSGRQVINMLDGLEDNLKSAREFNDKFGISLNAFDAGKIEEANDTFARVKTAMGGLSSVLAVQLAPIVTHLSNLFLQSGLDGETFGKAVANGMKVAGIAIDIIRHAMRGMRLTYQSVIFTISDLTAKLSLVLFDLGEDIAKTFSMIPGVSLEAEKGILKVGLAARKMANESKTGVKSLLKEMEKFGTTASKIAKIQHSATQRQLAKAIKDQSSAGIILNDVIDDKEKKTKKATKADKEAQKQAQELGTTFTSAFEKAIEGGEKFSDVLSSLAKDIEKMLFKKVVSDPLSSAIGDFTSQAFGGGSSDFISDIFGSLPSFDTGTSFVSQDMTANIHKGERILTADENRMFSRGAMGAANAVNVVINNNAGTQVTTTSQQTGDGTQLNVMIDQAVADNMNKSGSRTSQAMRNFSNRAMVRR